MFLIHPIGRIVNLIIILRTTYPRIRCQFRGARQGRDPHLRGSGAAQHAGALRGRSACRVSIIH
jgi:hypothetical protein